VRWADWDSKGDLAVVHYVNGRGRLEYPIGNVLYQSSGWISHIRFSPQGDKIAFMDHPDLWDNVGPVCVTDLSGKVKILTRQWVSEHGVAWSPDGKEIWFTAADKGNNMNLMAADLSGKVRTVLGLPVGLTLQDVASDGRVLVTLNSKRLALAMTTLGSKDDVELSWHDWNVVKDISADGQSVLFEDSSEAAGSGYAVALRKLDGSLPVRLGEGSAGGLSPDGKWAISISNAQPSRVTLLPVGPGQPRPVAVTDLEQVQSGWGQFRRDGKGIFVNGNQSGHASRCYFLELDGGKPKPVMPEGIPCGPTSPDGRLMAGEAPNATVVLYPLAGGPPSVVPGLESGFHPVQWSSDSSSIYGYRSGEIPSKIQKVNISTGKQTLVQELTPAAPAGVVMVAPIVVSPDGTRFAYSYSQILSVLYLISGLH
jgi:dipeptidyl aminopeptidase/acylaminoacyl peptidase